MKDRERLTLGRLGGKSRETLRWADALKEGILKGEWLLRYVFLPSKYPSGAIIIENSQGVRVKKSINADTVKEIARFLSLSKVKASMVKGILVFDESGEYYLEKYDADEGHGYIFTGQYFVYRQLDEVDILSEDF
ncbi:MAG: hypothetical protein QW706_09650 [Candidatus Nezhaarchaeales archaeon]